jgi:hydroxylysine kinase
MFALNSCRLKNKSHVSALRYNLALNIVRAKNKSNMMCDQTLLQPSEKVIKPSISQENAVEVIKELYGFSVTEIKELNGYDDRNFFFSVAHTYENPHVTCLNECGYLLKVTNSQDSKDSQFFDAQHQMILHLSKAGIVVPEPVSNRHGKLKSFKEFQSGVFHMVRVLKFIPGKILYDVDTWTTAIFYQCGGFIGRLGVVLNDFSHSAFKTRNSIWFLSNISQVREFVGAVQEDMHIVLLQDIFEAFLTEVKPVQDQLASGHIHGDFNEQNIIVRERNEHADTYDIHGVIDFGDSQKNPLVYDLAIAIMYMMTKCRCIHPNMVGGHVIAGYATQRQIPKLEMSLLRTLVAARYAQSLTLGAHSYLQEPDEYVLTTAKTGWKTLSNFWEMPSDELYSGWNTIIKNYSGE